MTTAVIDHLSHSQVQSFVNCPRKWHYEKVEQAPRERIPASFAFGIAIHDTLAQVNEASLAGEKVQASELFIKQWKLAVAGELPVHYGGKDSADDLLGKGHALVKAYTPPAGIIGVEQPFTVELAPDLPPVEGRIDIIRREQEDLALVDLKTSSSRLLSDTEGIEAQFALYDIAYPAKRHEAIVLGKLKTPTITVQPVVPWPREQLVRHYREVYQAMQAGVRYACRGWQCDGCAFATRCRKEG